jgi:4-amino-4-deoxy-L-arabinose transferase-like glycosyltransferase
MSGSAIKDRIWILMASVFAFVPFLGLAHLFDWDEINFAECAREMLVSNDYLQVQIGFKPFYEKPPLYIWFQVLSMKLFGINEFAARFPNAICGIISLQVIYSMGAYLKNRTFALWWVLAYACSFLPHFYFKSGIIDPWFNLFIFLSFFYVYRYFHQNSLLRYVLIAAFFLGLAVLTKGPVAILLLSLSSAVALAFSMYKKDKRPGDLLNKNVLFHALIFLLITLLPTAIWYGIVVWKNGPGLVYDFIQYQIRLMQTEDAGHGGFPGYHVVVLLIGCFPASIFAIRQLGRNKENDPMLYWMKSLFWVVLILFSIVQSKIVHYSSLAYFPITFMAAYTLHQNIEWRRWQKGLSLFLMGVLSAFIILLPWLGQNTERIKPLFQKDKFALANLSASVDWSGYESILGVILILGLALIVGFLLKNQAKKGIVTLFMLAFIAIQGIIYLFVPKIEGYSQRSAIDFFKAQSGQNVCVNTLGYKSYAHWFYGNIQPQNVCDALASQTNNHIHTYYVVTKITSGNPPELTNFERWYEKNGFVFWRKYANQTDSLASPSPVQ